MPGTFADTNAKQAVRTEWNTPLLKYLHERYGIKYRYMGLPGVELIDIHLWKDMIDEVVAFEVQAQRNDKDKDGRRNILRLRTNLKRLNVPSIAYFGPMEEVIIMRTDRDGQRYKQERLVTLYNLDFCNEITSKVDTAQSGRKLWRFEALRQILHDQAECYKATRERSLFVLLITVRNQMNAPTMRSLLANDLRHDTHQYIDVFGGVNGIAGDGPLIGSHTWAIKSLLYDKICQYMYNPHISAVFFPVVKYQGRPVSTDYQARIPSPMLHWMAICKFDDAEKASPSFWPHGFLKSSPCVGVTDDILSWDPEIAEHGDYSVPPSAVSWFQAHEAIFTIDGLNSSFR